MIFRHTLRRLFLSARTRTGRGPGQPRRFRQARLELESLEGRLVPAGELLFYSANAAVSETASVDASGTFMNQNVYPGFASWTHIAGVGGGEVLFYNANSGTAETASVDANGTFMNQNVYTGFASWTHIAGVGGGEVLFYNANSGTVETAGVDANGTFTNQNVYPGFASWTHIAGVGGGEVLFYNADSGTVETAGVDANGTFTNQNVYTGFASWTHIAGVGGGEILFYDANSGTVETASVDASGTFTNQIVYTGFSAWTHIVGVNLFDQDGGSPGMGGGGRHSGPGQIAASVNQRPGSSVLSDECVLSGQDAGHAPVREVIASLATEALFRDRQFQQNWAGEFHPVIQRSHAGTPQHGFLGERALADWFAFEDGYMPR